MTLASRAVLAVLLGGGGCTAATLPSFAPEGTEVSLGGAPRVFVLAEPAGMFGSLDLVGRTVVPMRSGAVAILGGEPDVPESAFEWTRYPVVEGLPPRMEWNRRFAYLTKGDESFEPLHERSGETRGRTFVELRGPVHGLTLEEPQRLAADPNQSIITSVLYAETLVCTRHGRRHGSASCHELANDFAVVVDGDRPPAGDVLLYPRRSQTPVPKVMAGGSYVLRARVLPSTRVVVWLKMGERAELLWVSSQADVRAQTVAGSTERFSLETPVAMPDLTRSPALESVTLLTTLLVMDGEQPEPEDFTSLDSWRTFVEQLPAHASRTTSTTYRITPSEANSRPEELASRVGNSQQK